MALNVSGFGNSTPNRRQIPGFNGQVREQVSDATFTAVSDDSALAEVWTLAIGTATAAAVYSVSIDVLDSNAAVVQTYDFSFTSTTAASTTDIAEQFVAAWNGNAQTYRIASASNSTATVTLTGQMVGVPFQLRESDAKINTPSNTVNAATAAPIYAGRLLCRNTTDSAFGNPRVFQPVAANFTAQVITHAVTSAASASFSGRLTIKGLNDGSSSSKVINLEPVVHNTDSATTVADIVTAWDAAVNSALGAGQGVVFTASTADLICTADVAGLEFDLEIIPSGSNSASVAKTYTTGPSASTSIRLAFAGVSERSDSMVAATVGVDDPQYAAGQPIPVNRGRAEMWVSYDSTETAPAQNGQVYVSTASATKGRLYTTGATTRVPVGCDQLRWLAADLVDGEGTITYTAALVGIAQG
jgi:hypothetical protein